MSIGKIFFSLVDFIDQRVGIGELNRQWLDSNLVWFAAEFQRPHYKNMQSIFLFTTQNKMH